MTNHHRRALLSKSNTSPIQKTLTSPYPTTNYLSSQRNSAEEAGLERLAKTPRTARKTVREPRHNPITSAFCARHASSVRSTTRPTRVKHIPETQLTLDLKTPSNPQRPGENDDEDDEVRDRLKSTVSGRHVFVFSTHQTG